jgi:ribonuclease-3
MRKVKKAISKKRAEELLEFQSNLGISFKNLELLNTALCHRSYVHEIDDTMEDNEKLEFLGDAFLGLVISDLLYSQNLYFREGTLARIKSYVVSQPTLHKIGKEIGIQRFILIGKGEEKSGGRDRGALISDCLEAVIGAYYIDSGYRRAKKLVKKLFFKEILEVEKNRHQKDYKTILQEYSQKRTKTVPEYVVVGTEGPEHQRRFFVNVRVFGKEYGPGQGRSKKQAEQEAAQIALKNLRKRVKMEEMIMKSESKGISEQGER